MKIFHNIVVVLGFGRSFVHGQTTITHGKNCTPFMRPPLSGAPLSNVCTAQRSEFPPMESCAERGGQVWLSQAGAAGAGRGCLVLWVGVKETGGGKKQGEVENRSFGSPSARCKTGHLVWPAAPGKMSGGFRCDRDTSLSRLWRDRQSEE